jgi:hypothetical protein
LITECPGELQKCQNSQDAVNSKLIKFDQDEEGLLREVGKCHIPCPPLAFDFASEKTFLLDVAKFPILCGIKPAFLVHKFEKVISPEASMDILHRWGDFMLMEPKAHNTKESSSSRSTSSKSYHLGIWRQYSQAPYITQDTRCMDEKKEVNIEEKKRCNNFLRLVKTEVATKIRSFLQRYAKDEWATREK